jgi:pimeloyl-ACP methyl ester carboxylesterase
MRTRTDERDADAVWDPLMPIPVAILAIVLFGCSSAAESSPDPRPTVVLLHGLARGASSMSRMASALESAGFRVCNLAYPSRQHSVAVLASDFVAPAIRDCGAHGPVNFVTHSLGGILVRQLSVSEPDIEMGRVVMLSPPNQGSEIVDKLGHWRLYQFINGPAGGELGTAADSLPRRLGPPAFELGVITGSRSINLFLSTLIPGTDDGKVSVESAKLDGMRDFRVVKTSHPFIMRNRQVIAETIRFLQDGSFSPDELASPGEPARSSTQCTSALTKWIAWRDCSPPRSRCCMRRLERNRALAFYELSLSH